jgi:3-oxoacyl-[acyl-carrier protein] reductase
MSISTDRAAIVTGGSRGIGRKVAERLAQEGFAVAVIYAGNRPAADETVATIIQAGGTAHAWAADVADAVAMTKVFDDVEADFGEIDVVVNAAGIMPLGSLTDLDLSELDSVLRTNVRGTFVVDQLAALRARRGGAIINISSSVTRFQNPGNIAYTASKGAVEAITMVLARELRGRDITVNAVAPGAIATEMFEQFLRDGGEKERARIAGQSPLERLGTVEDIAEVVAFLAAGARWVNGQVLFANGGAI